MSRALTRRALLRGGAGLAAAAALAACLPPPVQRARRGPAGCVVVGLGAEPAGLDPLQHTGLGEAGVYTNIYDSLLGRAADGTLIPALAESYRALDERTWEFRLRRGVSFHNGEAFDSDSVRATLEYLLDPAGKSPIRAQLETIERVETPEPHVAIVATRQPFAPLLAELAGLMMLPPRALGEAGPEALAQKPVGTGPFRFVEWVRGDRLTLETNEAHWRGSPGFQRLELRPRPDTATHMAEARAGQLSLSVDVPVDHLPALEQAGLRIAERPGIQALYVRLNARKPPLDDPRLRHALSLGIDRQALVDTVLLGRGRPGLPSFVHPDSPWALAGMQPHHDPAAAESLLDEAGYARGPDGVRRAPDGAPLRFSVLVSSFEPQDIRAVQLAAQQLEPLGVRLQAEVLDPATLRERRTAPPGQIPTYDMYVSVLEAHAHVDPDALYYFFHSPGPKGFGGSITGYTNPDFDRLAEAATTAEIPERKQLWARMQELLAAENPVLVLWYRDGEYAFRPADYDGWVSDFGHGIFTKRSFLPTYVEAARAEREAQAAPPALGGAAEEAGSAGGGPSGGVLVLLGIVAAGGLGLLALRRRRAAADEDD